VSPLSAQIFLRFKINGLDVSVLSAALIIEPLGNRDSTLKPSFSMIWFRISYAIFD